MKPSLLSVRSAGPTARGRPPALGLRLVSAAFPVLLAASPVGPPSDARPTELGLPPPPRATDVWLGDRVGAGDSGGLAEPGEPGWTAETTGSYAADLAPAPAGAPPGKFPLLRPPARPHDAAPPAGLSEGFELVGSVAVLAGDELTATLQGTGFGLARANLAEVSKRFIRAFGDDYDQIAVFLGFSDRLSVQSLAYQMPVKNDVRGLGLGIFDATAEFGSPSGRMETILNMKRINVYGLDAADDPTDSLYPVWAQEAAHRWLTYFRFRRPADAKNREDLLGRQSAHWGRWVHADASLLDGVFWRDNGDGTFTPAERDKRYGPADQYAMGLRRADEVPAFFLLDDFIDENGLPVERDKIALGADRKYKATRTDVTIADIVRAVGKREPETGGAAADLRMGVVFLTPPGVPAAAMVGESFLLDRTRAPWDNFYNGAGGGRGMVCTELLRPCRGPSFVFDAPVLTPVAPGGAGSGVVAPGDKFTLALPVRNLGTDGGQLAVEVTARLGVRFDNPRAGAGTLPIGQTARLTFTGQIPADAPCGYPVKLDFEAAGPLGPSRGSHSVVLGLQPHKLFDFEAPDTGATWRVNPENSDTATAGRWELGTPQTSVATVLKSFVVQPGGAFSGSNAFATGLSAGENEAANDLDFDRTAVGPGRTTLESPVIDLTGLRAPWLSYRLYFVAVDFDRRVLVPAAEDHFQVLASPDGVSWVEIDRVEGMGLGWQQRRFAIARLADLFGGVPASLRFRFIAEDSDVSDNVVEAVLDDVEILTEAASCTTSGPPQGGAAGNPGTGGAGAMPPPGGDGCGCRIGQPSGPPGGAWAGLLLVAGLLFRRRRGRRSR